MDAIGRYYSQKNGSSSKYYYIADQDQLIKAFNDSRNYLNYALLKQSDRQRFLVANSQGLQERFFKMINEDISKAASNLQKSVAQDLYGYLMAAIQGGSYSSSKNSAFGVAIGRMLGNAFTDMLSDIWDSMNQRD